MPKSPKKPTEAASAKPGLSDQPQPLSGSPGKYKLGSTKVKPSLLDKIKDALTTKYEVGIRLEYTDKKKDSQMKMPGGHPVKFRIKVGKDVYEGELDAKGEALVGGLPEKQCQISFPEIDEGEIKGPTKEPL